MNSSLSRSLGLAVLSIFLQSTLGGGTAIACHEVGDGCCDTDSGGVCECGDDLAGDVTLTDDVVCSSGTAITFTSDSTLDLNGYQIICTGTCGTAIDFDTHSGTIDGPGVIDGFALAVDGNDNANTIVKRIAIVNNTSGIDRVDEASYNVIVGTDSTGASRGIVADSEARIIEDNVIANFGTGLLLNGGTSSSLKIRRNTAVANGAGINTGNNNAESCNDSSSGSPKNTFVGNGDDYGNGNLGSDCDLDMSKNLCISESSFSDVDCGVSPLLGSWQLYDATP